METRRTDGSPRLLDIRTPLRRIRVRSRPDGSTLTARYRTPDGWDIRVGSRRSQIHHQGTSRAIHTPAGLRLFASGQAITHYDANGAPEARMSMTGAPLTIPTAATPSPRRDSFGAAFEYAYRARAEAGHANDGVFLGDSLVSHLNGLNDPEKREIWSELAGNHDFMNGAIAGDRVAHLLARTWAIRPTAKLVAIQIGTNDHNENQPVVDPLETAEAIARLVAETSRIASEATIILIAIPPSSRSVRHARNQQTNELIAGIADGHRVLFRHGGTGFDPTDPTHSSDGVHMSAEGSALWYLPLAPLFRGILAAN